jgi:AraC-like DNA-binding protein
MKALRLRTRTVTVCVGETLGGVSRERRRSRWNISRSMPTSITPWPRWRGRTVGWSANNGWKSIAYAALGAALEALPAPARTRFIRHVRLAGPLAGALDHVQMNLGGELDNQALATRCGISPDHLQRLFRRHLGQTPAAFVLERRIAAAAHDLAYANASIEHIASNFGFADRFSFSKAFKRLVGTAPAAWRERHQRVVLES